MSGVFGIVDSKRRPSVNQLLAQMGAAMSHREWYRTETYCEDSVGVGLGRIGIGVFNQERQPVCSEDENLIIFLAGEFYDTAKVRRDLTEKGRHLRDDSDAELALRLYQEKGEAFVRDLEGAFVLAIRNRSQHEVIVVNDRFGLYPLLYAHFDGKLIFAPEMKGVLCDPDFRKELNMTALAEYTRFQHLLGDKTFFEELELLPAASFLCFRTDTDHLTLQPYWTFSQIPALPLNVTFGEAAEEAGRLLKLAVDKLTGGGHRLGLYLSGGMDSRAILGFIDRSKMPITSITFGQKNCRDVVYAEQIASKIGTKHHYFEFTDGGWVKEFADFHLTLTEGFHSWIHSHGINILKQVRSLIDVNLTGLHGAEINWEDPALYHAPDDVAFACRLFNLLSQDTTWPSITGDEETILFSARVTAQMRGLAFDSLRAELAKYTHFSHHQLATCFSCNTDRRLFQYYTVFNRSHVEQRFPFYDYSYFGFIHSLPPEMLFKRRLRRAIILDRMKPLARIPYDKDDLPIMWHEPAKLVRKVKRYVTRRLAPVFPEYPTLYADYEKWLRHELREWGEDFLLSKRTLQRDLFNPEFLASLWHRHQSELEVNMIGKIAPLMTLEMMLRKFFDESP